MRKSKTIKFGLFALLLLATWFSVFFGAYNNGFRVGSARGKLEGIRLTTVSVCNFEVQHLVSTDDEDKGFRHLCDFIRNNIEPDSWQHPDKWISIDSETNELRISQIGSTNDQIKMLLEQLTTLSDRWQRGVCTYCGSESLSDTPHKSITGDVLCTCDKCGGLQVEPNAG